MKLSSLVISLTFLLTACAHSGPAAHPIPGFVIPVRCLDALQLADTRHPCEPTDSSHSKCVVIVEFHCVAPAATEDKRK